MCHIETLQLPKGRRMKVEHPHHAGASGAADWPGATLGTMQHRTARRDHRWARTVMS